MGRSCIQLVSGVALVLGLVACDDFSHDAIVNTPPPNYVSLLMTKTVWGRLDDQWNSLALRPDGGLTVAGATTTTGKGEISALLTTMDADHEVEWLVAVGGWGRDHAEDVLLTQDGNLLVVGGTSSYSLISQEKPNPNDNPLFDYRDQNMLMALADASGNIIWERAAGDQTYQERATSALNVPFGFLVAGVSKVGEDEKLVLTRVSTSGEPAWYRTYSVPAVELETRVVETDDGAYMLVGHGLFMSSRYRDPIVLKVDAGGIDLWQKSYGFENSQERLFSVVSTGDGVVGCGSAHLYLGTDSTVHRLYLLKIDLNGNEVWENTYEQTAINEGRAIVMKTDGSFIVCGQNSATGRIHAAKISAGGDLLWSDGTGILGEASDMTKIPRGYAVIGTVLQDGSSDLRDGFVLEFEEDLTHIE